jgi:ABC-type branched-subunit amino acid transport system substrate-binding protein
MGRSTNRRRSRAVAWAALVGTLGVVGALLVPAAGAAATPRAVTASNGTITVAGLGYKQNYGDADVGAQARFKRANDDHEIKGYTIDYKEFADENNDPANALAESRRLVTEDRVVAIVPELSSNTPGDYLTQQQVPWFGSGFDSSYCPASGKDGFGFGVNGCLAPESPTKLPSAAAELLKKEYKDKKGIDHPTVAIQGTDAAAGQKAVQYLASEYQGAGWKVVYAKGSVPAPPTVVGDFTPYVNALLSSNNGKQPDVIISNLAAQGGGLQLFDLLKSSGFTGALSTVFYSNLLVKPLEGAYISTMFAGYEANTPALQQMEKDVAAVKPGAQNTLTLFLGYASADMFIQAVKASLKSSKTLTSTSIQKAASKMTYDMKNTIGPIEYPASYKYAVKSCAGLMYDADGTAFTIAQPYTCSTKTYPILAKYAQ